MTNNVIYTLPVNVFNGLSALTTLDLSKNNILQLDKRILSGLTSLKIIKIEQKGLLNNSINEPQLCFKYYQFGFFQLNIQLTKQIPIILQHEFWLMNSFRSGIFFLKLIITRIMMYKFFIRRIRFNCHLQITRLIRFSSNFLSIQIPFN